MRRVYIFREVDRHPAYHDGELEWEYGVIIKLEEDPYPLKICWANGRVNWYTYAQIEVLT